MTWATRPVGDRGVLVELPDSPAALRVARALTGRAEFVEVVPGHRTVLLTWASEEPPQDLDALVQVALTTDPPPAAGRRIEIPVVYDGADLDEVAQLVQLSPEEVVARHTAAEYVAAFIGFAPGFAYLLGGDELLAVPRRPQPRKRVPAGSVAIAGPYSGVYPRDTPGGWRLLGRTSVSLFDATRERPALLASGDLVRFVRV
ncbi:MAG: 5-oxoprolinase subunit PxpB [Gaiellaceae bacterium]